MRPLSMAYQQAKTAAAARPTGTAREEMHRRWRRDYTRSVRAKWSESGAVPAVRAYEGERRPDPLCWLYHEGERSVEEVSTSAAAGPPGDATAAGLVRGVWPASD